MISLALIQALTLMLYSFVWGLIYARRREGTVNRYFRHCLVAIWSWAFIELFLYFPMTEGHELELRRVAALCWIAASGLFLRFVYRLLGMSRGVVFHVLAGLLIVNMVIYVATDAGIRESVRGPYGVVDVNGPFQPLLSLVPAFCAVLAAGLLVRALGRGPGPVQRRSLRLILAGVIVSLVVGFSTDGFLPLVLGPAVLPPLGSLAALPVCFLLYGAVVRYGFLSIDPVQVAEELFEDVGHGIVLADREDRVRRINRAGRQLLGIEVLAPGSLTVAELMPGLPAGGEETVEVALTRDGVERWFEVTTVASSRAGVQLGRILLLREVTEHRRIEKLLEFSAKEVKKELRRREQELERARKREEVGTITGVIAHDFNNLLVGIVGFANAAYDDLPRGHTNRDDLKEVLRAGRRAQKIIAQVLAYSRPGKTEREELTVAAELDEALKLAELSLPANIQVRRELSRGRGTVLADRARLKQVLMNLFANAQHAMHPLGGRLEATYELIDVDEKLARDLPPLKPGQAACISVRDSGCGMDAETMDRIFDPFFSTKDTSQGTGLGLSTARQIVEDHGGALTVESTLGRGSTFHVYLPLVLGSGDPTTPSVPDVTTPRGAGERVMLVDDEPMMRRTGVRLLEPLGYEVQVFDDPREALEAYKREPSAFDAVVTDYSMPGMSGLLLSAELLRLDERLPIVLVSGNASVMVQAQAVELGVAEFLPKPTTRNALGTALRRALDR